MKYIPLAARICLCLIFFKAGVSHVFGFGETVEMMTNQGLPLANILLAGVSFKFTTSGNSTASTHKTWRSRSRHSDPFAKFCSRCSQSVQALSSTLECRRYVSGNY
jgi:hypothetical protein